MLAQALLAQGKFKELTTEFGDRKLGDPAARSELNVALAVAALAQGDAARGKALADAALADQPGNVDALLLEARLAASGQGGLAAARGFVGKALAASPNNVDALLLEADIDFAEAKDADAKKTLQQAIDAHPTSVPARAALFEALLRDGKLDAAKAQMAKMKEIAPNDFRSLLSDALISAMSGDNTHARAQVQRILAVRPDHLPSLFLLGVIDYQLGSYGSAEDTLRKVIAKVPANPSPRHLLALLYLRTGQAAAGGRRAGAGAAALPRQCGPAARRRRSVSGTG